MINHPSASLLCTVLLAALPAASFAADAGQKPNIVLILADDLGIGDLSIYNKDSKIATPAMNKLAGEGMRFTDMHSPSSVCTPTRYGLLTGRYCWRSALKRGVGNGYSPIFIEPGRATIASMLRAKGYHTVGVGKWHLGLGDKGRTDYAQPFNAGPVTCGFDEFQGIPASLDMEPYVWIINDRAEKEPTETIANSKHRREGGGGFWRGGPIAPGFKHVDVLPRIETVAIEMLERRAKEPAKPFFLYVPLSGPHTPWMPTPDWRGKSKVDYYGDFVMQTDHTIGVIVAALERLKMNENTILIVTSDNGSHWPVSDIEKYGHASNHIYRGQKSDIHEAGHRVPFIVRWPGKVKTGSVSEQTACLTDMFATLAAFVGEQPGADAAEDSFNLLPAMLGQDEGKPIRPAVVHHSGDGMFAIRAGPWKLVMGLGSGGFTAPKTVKPKAGEPVGQLYNLLDDPAEKKNVYAEHPEIVARLSALLERYKSQGFSNR